MTSLKLRRQFLDFFQRNGHTVVPSDSLVPTKDPTLLFTSAGMNPFKDYFLGVKRDMKRAASCQKCFRTSDVEQVGQTPSHLTFFEMLGNFSFGDYFKAEAIRFALDFLTVELKIPPDRLWASVYEKDEETFRIWTQSLNYPPERVIRFGAKENFWPSNAPTAGPNGPCGPCSEIYYDYERCTIGKTCPDPDRCSPACSCGRFVEVWNLVFTQFDRKEGGQLDPLPSKNIDTGMGLERLAAVMQNKMSVFETDLFEPIIEALVHSLRQEAPEVLQRDQRGFIYSIVDHVRALTFLIGDGVVPSNEGRGYVLKMLLRKAARAGMTLGFKKPFLYQLVPVVTKIMGEAYPELVGARESIAKVVLSEEERFQQTLKEKIPLLEKEIKLKGRMRELLSEKAKSMEGQLRRGEKIERGTLTEFLFPAEDAARFYDTHGLSFEEITEVCKDMKVYPPTREDFEKALVDLQFQSKASSKFEGAIFSKDALTEVVASIRHPTEFIGYNTELNTQARVLGLIQENRLVKSAQAPALAGVILDRSPFYGEAGGQVGDTGQLQAPQGKLKVLDTQWVGNALLHRAELLEGQIQVNDGVTASVDRQRRRQVAQNHTGTHLLHAALRRVLGAHVVQAGSLVASEKIRFDFSHGQAVPTRQLESVEELVNEWVEADLSVNVAQISMEEARKTGAIALFGEKYGTQVRVVSIGEVSKELCGGTHLKSSSQIGCLTIIEQGSVAAGIRRLEALTGQRAFSHLKGGWVQLSEIAQRLKAPTNEVNEAVERLAKQIKELEAQLRHLKVKGAHDEAQRLVALIEEVNPFRLLVTELEEPMDPPDLRSLADKLRKGEPNLEILLWDPRGFCISASGEKAREKISAVELLNVAKEIAGGSGGGRPDLAQGRIEDLSKEREIKERVKKFVQEQTKG